ncbi:MAG: right-handed parallel beta-helix repeat-containing protein, partial [bacterium]
NVDAVAVGGGGLHLSFDTTVDLGGGLTPADEDLVLFVGGGFVLSFDGSAAGLDPTLDLDAANVQPDGSFVLSLDHSGTIGGVVFDDDTVLIHDGSTWAVAVDASELDAGFGAADLVAVPEPGLLPGLLLGAVAFAGAARRRRRVLPMLVCAALASSLLVLGADPAHAAGGVREINQTCAVETGCFSGDTPGFPVTIDGSAGKSYVLTSDLAIATDANGVEVSSSYVTLDLGGFEIVGPATCTGTSASLSCSGASSGVGVVGFGLLYGITVRDGVVRNMWDGVGLGGTGSVGMRIEGVVARHNVRLGFGGQDGVLIRDCAAIENGGNGFDLDAGSTVESSIAIGNFGHGVEIDDVGGVVSGTTSRSNAGRGFNVVAGSEYGKDNVSTGNVSEDSCGGGICTERTRYYLSDTTSCAPGFRQMYVAELLSIGSMALDHARTMDVGFYGRAITFGGGGPWWFRMRSPENVFRCGIEANLSGEEYIECPGGNPDGGAGVGTARRHLAFTWDAYSTESSPLPPSAAGYWCVES